MGKYNEKLDSIFKEWIEKSKRTGKPAKTMIIKILFLHMTV
jgi:hypothetical protein